MKIYQRFLTFFPQMQPKTFKHFNAKFLRGIPLKVETCPLYLLTESLLEKFLDLSVFTI